MKRTTREPFRDAFGVDRAPAARRGRKVASGLLRLFHLLALGLILVCAGVASPARAMASVAATADAVAPDVAEGARRASPPRCKDFSAPSVELDALEADDDDDDRVDDDPLRDVEARRAAFRSLWPPHTRGPDLRLAADRPPSRFKTDPGLPRGPPAALADALTSVR